MAGKSCNSPQFPKFPLQLEKICLQIWQAAVLLNERIIQIRFIKAKRPSDKYKIRVRNRSHSARTNAVTG
jgi:hypothetical protein